MPARPFILVLAMVLLLFSVLTFATITNTGSNFSVNGTTLTANTTVINTSDTTPEIGFNITGNTSTINFTVYVDAAPKINGTTSNSTIRLVNLINLGNGTHSFSIESWPTFNGLELKQDALNSTGINFTVDDTAPTISLISPVNNTNTSNTTLEILFNITDNFHLINFNFTVFVDGSPQSITGLTGNNTQTRFNISGQANGTHTVQVQGRDPASNVANSTIFNFTVDDTAPTPTITAPVNATNTTDTTPEITFNIIDNFHTVDLNFTVFVNGTAEDVTGIVNNNTATKYNLSARANGTYAVLVQGNDTAGNFANSSILTITVDTGAPTPTLTLSATSIVIGNSITITCTASDNLAEGSPTVSISVTKPAGSAVTATSGVAFTDTSEAGTYSVSCTATDAAGNSKVVTSTFSATANPAGSGSGGGGGGSPVQPKTTIIFNQLNQGNLTVIKISNSQIGFREISIEVNNPAQSVSITVTKLAGQPASVTQSVSGSVYQYLDVSATSLPDANIRAAKIKFSVPKSWLAQNGFTPADISLRRFSASAWQKLATVQTGETASDYEFEAETPGFSTFAVAAEEAPAPTPSPAPAPTPSPAPAPTPSPAPAPTPTPAQQPQPGIGTDVAAGIIAIIIIIIGGYWYYRRKR